MPSPSTLAASSELKKTQWGQAEPDPRCSPAPRQLDGARPGEPALLRGSALGPASRKGVWPVGTYCG